MIGSSHPDEIILRKTAVVVLECLVDMEGDVV